MIRSIWLGLLLALPSAAGALCWTFRDTLRAFVDMGPATRVAVELFIAWLAFATAFALVAWIKDWSDASRRAAQQREQEERNHARIVAGVRTSAQAKPKRVKVVYSNVDPLRREITIRRQARTPFVDVPLP